MDLCTLLQILEMTLFLINGMSFTVPGVVCLSRPSYISPWMHMDSSDPQSTHVILEHGFGVRPVKAEVQVMSASSGFVFPGVKSGYSANDVTGRKYGGVICLYNETHVRLFAAVNLDNSTQGSKLIYTGSSYWTAEFRESHRTAMVRVQVWHPYDLPLPTFSKTLLLQAGAQSYDNYAEVFHHLGLQPNLTVVQYTPHLSSETDMLYGWTAEGQGFSSHPITINLNWGGLVFGVNSSSVRLWAPNNDQGRVGIFSVCEGWGYDLWTDCNFKTANVTVSVWADIESQTYQYHSEFHHTADESTNQHEISLSLSINLDEDLIQVTVSSIDPPNDGFHFHGTGAVAVKGDQGIACGGLVYAYSNVTNAVRIWHPTGENTSLIHIKGMGNGTSTQLSAFGMVNIYVWKAKDPCENVPEEHGVNASITLSAVHVQCQANYTCLSGFSYITGSTVRTYNPYTAVWSGSALVCAYIHILDCVNTLPPSINSNFTLTTTKNGCLATFTCLPGYDVVKGDFTIDYNNADGKWNGTGVNCQVLCAMPTSIENATFSLYSNNTYAGAIVTYTCKDGYAHVSGDLVRGCTETGTWSGTLPTCLVASPDCWSTLSSGVNSQLSLNVSTDNCTATYSCLSGYEMVGGDYETIYDYYVREWLGTAAECQVVCQAPQSVQNAAYTLSSSDVYLGTTATYMCNNGYYHASGDLISVCTADGTWSGTAPNCTNISAGQDCSSNIPSGVNANMTFSKFDNFCMVTYFCLSGYFYISGLTVITYDMVTNKWLGSAMECQILCPLPIFLTYGTYKLSSDLLVPGTVVSYQCDTGYSYTTGNLFRACTMNGTWSGEMPVCSDGTTINDSTTLSAGTVTGGYTAITTSTSITIDTTTSVQTSQCPTTVTSVATSTSPTTSTMSSTTGKSGLKPEVCFNTSTSINITEVNIIAEEIVSNLTVAAKTTSRYQRTLVSVQDNRTSSVTIGICGALFCGLVLTAILLADLSNLWIEKAEERSYDVANSNTHI